jgi:hypothetical protein
VYKRCRYCLHCKQAPPMTIRNIATSPPMRIRHISFRAGIRGIGMESVCRKRSTRGESAMLAGTALQAVAATSTTTTHLLLFFSFFSSLAIILCAVPPLRVYEKRLAARICMPPPPPPTPPSCSTCAHVASWWHMWSSCRVSRDACLPETPPERERERKTSYTPSFRASLGAFVEP